jgi:hypothetical protein
MSDSAVAGRYKSDMSGRHDAPLLNAAVPATGRRVEFFVFAIIAAFPGGWSPLALSADMDFSSLVEQTYEVANSNRSSNRRQDTGDNKTNQER